MDFEWFSYTIIIGSDRRSECNVEKIYRVRSARLETMMPPDCMHTSRHSGSLSQAILSDWFDISELKVAAFSCQINDLVVPI